MYTKISLNCLRAVKEKIPNFLYWRCIHILRALVFNFNLMLLYDDDDNNNLEDLVDV